MKVVKLIVIGVGRINESGKTDCDGINESGKMKGDGKDK